MLVSVMTGVFILILNDEEYAPHTFLLLILLMAGTCLWAIPIVYDRTYKQAQIDAINGTIKYRLEKNSDGTTEWKEINK